MGEVGGTEDSAAVIEVRGTAVVSVRKVLGTEVSEAKEGSGASDGGDSGKVPAGLAVPVSDRLESVSSGFSMSVSPELASRLAGSSELPASKTCRSLSETVRIKVSATGGSSLAGT